MRWRSLDRYHFRVDRRFSSCRSYGAWLGKRGRDFYTHGAPNGAWTSKFVDSFVPPGSLQPVGFGGQNEIAFRQAVNLVRPCSQLYFSPGEVDIRVMTLGFG